MDNLRQLSQKVFHNSWKAIKLSVSSLFWVDFESNHYQKSNHCFHIANTGVCTCGSKNRQDFDLSF